MPPTGSVITSMTLCKFWAANQLFCLENGNWSLWSSYGTSRSLLVQAERGKALTKSAVLGSGKNYYLIWFLRNYSSCITDFVPSGPTSPHFSYPKPLETINLLCFYEFNYIDFMYMRSHSNCSFRLWVYFTWHNVLLVLLCCYKWHGFLSLSFFVSGH